MFPKKLQTFETALIDPKYPHNSLVITNPNHLNHFLRFFHLSLNIEQKFWGFDLESLYTKFRELNISSLILRFVEQRGVVPN